MTWRTRLGSAQTPGSARARPARPRDRPCPRRAACRARRARGARPAGAEVDGARVAEEVADEMVQAGGLLVEDAEEGLPVLGGDAAAAQGGDGVGDDCQRVAHLVGHHGGELAHRGELLLAHQLVLRGAQLLVGAGEGAGAVLELAGAGLELTAQVGEAGEEGHDHAVDEGGVAEGRDGRAGRPSDVAERVVDDGDREQGEPDEPAASRRPRRKARPRDASAKSAAATVGDREGRAEGRRRRGRGEHRRAEDPRHLGARVVPSGRARRGRRRSRGRRRYRRAPRGRPRGREARAYWRMKWRRKTTAPMRPPSETTSAWRGRAARPGAGRRRAASPPSSATSARLSRPKTTSSRSRAGADRAPAGLEVGSVRAGRL